jgi:hypothetical protein
MRRPILSILTACLVSGLLLLSGCKNPADGSDSPDEGSKDTVASPAFNISTGTYSADQGVTVTCATASAEIHYTADGSKPDSSSPVYGGAIPVAGHGTVKTIRAIAIKAGMLDSAEASVTITINYNKVSTPQFDPAGGTYTTARSVQITCATPGVEIRYTTNNDEPSSGSGAVYGGPIPIASNCTLKAIAYKSGMTDSTIASAAYKFPPAAPVMTGAVPGFHKVTVTWNPVTGADAYNLYYAKGSTVDTASGTKVENITGTTKDISFTKGGETYAFIVTAVKENVEGAAGSAMTAVPAKGWTPQGGIRFSPMVYGSDHAYSVDLDSNNLPYIAIRGFDSSKATVMKFNGTTWNIVGTADFSTYVGSYLFLAIGKNDIPYIAYADRANSAKATVMKFNGATWEIVGTAGFSAGAADYLSFAIDSNDIPYVAYSTYASGGKATVMKFGGATWEVAGNQEFSADIAWGLSLAIGANDTPFLAYADNAVGNKATVMKLNPTTSNWELVGAAGFSAGRAADISLAFDANGVPYLGYGDLGNGDKATVMKFNGTAWANVGTAGFSPNKAYYTALAIGPDNVPYLAYQDGSSWKTNVMKFDGAAWDFVGPAGISEGRAIFTSLDIGSDGVPCVTYYDCPNNENKATVMRFE